MREELKEILTVNRVKLVKGIQLDESLWNELIANKILDKSQRDHIKFNKPMDQQIGELLDLIERGPDEVFDGLRQCLHNTNQSHIADTLLCSPVKSLELPAPIGASCSPKCSLPEKEKKTDGDSLLRRFQCDLEELNESLSAEDKKQCLPDAITVNLCQHANTISKRLVLIDDLLTLLVAEKCIHARLKQIILTKDKSEDQAIELIECISKSHLHTYKVFLKFLQCTNQSHLFDILNTGDAVISSIVKIRVELYMNSFVYNGAESLRQLYKQVQADICNEESEISKLLKPYHPRLEALSVDLGSMIIYVWTPCPDACTSLQKACDSGDLGQRIQSALIDITGTCLYDPRVIVTCIQDNDKIPPPLESQMSSLTVGTVLPKVAKLESFTASFSDAATWRLLEEKLRDSGSSLIGGFCAQLSNVGIISPEVAFHVQDSGEEDGKMTRLVKELGLERDMSAEVEYVVRSNTGSFDLLLNSLIGVFGNTKYHRLLTPVLGVDGVDGTASKRARYVVGKILTSKRRFFKNGVEFCIRVVASSQQRELIGALTNVIGTRWLTSDDPETLMAADILRLSEIETHPVRPQKAKVPGCLTSDDPDTRMAAEKLRLSKMKTKPKAIATEWMPSEYPKVSTMAADILPLSEKKTNPARLQKAKVPGSLTSDDPDTHMAAEKLRLSKMKTKPVRSERVIVTRRLSSDDPDARIRMAAWRLSEMKTKHNVIGTEWWASDDPETLMAANILPLSEMKTNPVRLQVSGLGNAKYYPNVTSLAHVDEITAAGVMKESQHLNNVTSICFKRTTITYEVTEVLSRITSLDALCFADTHMGLASKPSDKQSSLWSLSAINVQYLRLSSCGLTSGDVNALLAACGRLRHLDISGNAAIKHVKAGSFSSLTGLSVEDTSLTDDDIIQLVEESRGSLEFLNASSLSMSAGSCCDILTRCPQLRELYVRGDGLLKALHWKVKCSIEHIYLSGCSNSKYSLRYVLERHPSITCITAPTMQCELSTILVAANHRIKSLFVSKRMARYDFLEDLLKYRDLTQLWLEGYEPWNEMPIEHFITRTTSIRTVGLQGDLAYAHHFLKHLERPLQRIWLVVSDKEDYPEVIEKTEKRLGMTPGMIQLVTDPDGLYGTYTRESGLFYTHLPDTLPNDFRPVIGKP